MPINSSVNTSQKERFFQRGEAFLFPGLTVNTSQKERFSTLTDEFIRKIQYKINRRPRKKLNFESPKIVFFSKNR